MAGKLAYGTTGTSSIGQMTEPDLAPPSAGIATRSGLSFCGLLRIVVGTSRLGPVITRQLFGASMLPITFPHSHSLGLTCGLAIG
jgi:hypothetical protein